MSFSRLEPVDESNQPGVSLFSEKIMVLLLLEALGALLLLVFIVWWTMFSGREKGELKDRSAPSAPDAAKAKEDEKEKAKGAGE
jgi:hypothetical protein